MQMSEIVSKYSRDFTIVKYLKKVKIRYRSENEITIYVYVEIKKFKDRSSNDYPI